MCSTVTLLSTTSRLPPQGLGKPDVGARLLHYLDLGAPPKEKLESALRPRHVKAVSMEFNRRMYGVPVGELKLLRGGLVQYPVGMQKLKIRWVSAAVFISNL